MKKILSLVALFIISLQTNAQPSFIKDSLDNYINKGLKDWQVPGLAIVIVKDGKVVVQKGFGVKNIITNEAVDENTAFFIASNSKLFTGTALANLEFEKKLSLNDKISKYYPNYKLYDKNTAALVTIKDMLTHRIGTKTFQGDFTFWNTKLSRADIMNRMQYLKPVNDFRDVYGYCNSCFLTAGEVIPKVTGGISWEQYVTNTMLKPLAMNNSYSQSNGIEKKIKNIATPYTTSFTNILQTVPYDIWDNLGPAASIVSNVSDLSHWLQFQLDSGRYEGKQILPWAVLQKTRDMNIYTSSRKSAIYPIHFRGYGLGVFGADYNGKQIYWHTGGAAGMVSNVCFVPEEKLGIAILTNNDNQNFFECLRYQILDAYLGVSYINRSAPQLKNFNEDMTKQVKEVGEWKTIAKSKEEILNYYLGQYKKYEGSYSNQLYGKIEIKSNGNFLTVKFLNHDNLTGTLKPLSNDEWLYEYSNIEYGIFKTKFTMEKEKVKSISIKANDFVEYDAYDFVKVK
jgi:CubicO group peptidase (beta-lactamase class C family)